MRTEDPSREPANEDARDGNRVQSVDRAVLLLRAISTSAHPPTAWELARACGINRSTAWRLLQTLEHHALVERDPTTGRYGIGYTALEVAASAGYDGLARRARGTTAWPGGCVRSSSGSPRRRGRASCWRPRAGSASCTWIR